MWKRQGMATQNEQVGEQGDEKQGHGWRGRLSGPSLRLGGSKCRGGHDSPPVSPVLIGTNSV